MGAKQGGSGSAALGLPGEVGGGAVGDDPAVGGRRRRDVLEGVDGVMGCVGESDLDAEFECAAGVGEVVADGGSGKDGEDLAEGHAECVGSVVESDVGGEHGSDGGGLAIGEWWERIEHVVNVWVRPRRARPKARMTGMLRAGVVMRNRFSLCGSHVG